MYLCHQKMANFQCIRQKNKRVYFVLLSFFRNSDLLVEDSLALKYSNKFGISLAYSYLCSEKW